MEFDHQLRQFVATIFCDMRMRSAETQGGSHNRTPAGSFGNFKRQLKIMHFALDPMHTSGFETLFTFLTLNYNNAYSLMSAHCTAILEDCDDDRDVFISLMYTCSFTYSLLSFCENESNHRYLILFTYWFEAMFSDSIKPKFTAANGWEGLSAFCSSRNLHFILDFINLCYNKQGKLFTYLTIDKSYYFYGLHHDDTLTLLKNNFQGFKEIVFNEFRNELDCDLIYKTGVIVAFVKIELALDITASVYNPPSPARRLLHPTTNMFRTHMWDNLKRDIPASIGRLLIKQSRIFARQKRKFYMQKIINANKERARAHQQRILYASENNLNPGPVFSSHDDIIAAIQQSIHDVRTGSAFGQYQNVAATVPSIEVPCLNEQAAATLSYDVHTMQQIIYNTEKALSALNLYQVAEEQTIRQLSADAERTFDAINLYHSVEAQPIDELSANAGHELTAVKLHNDVEAQSIEQLDVEQELAALNLHASAEAQPIEQLSANAEQANVQIRPNLISGESFSTSEEASSTRPRRMPLFRVVLVRKPPDEDVSGADVGACTTCCFHKPKK